jgi:L-alanine-DL-glutamate epimerase-like enolase superfamily enzyme
VLNRQASERLEVNANLGALDSQAADRVVGTAGFRVYKLKVGLAPVADELALLRHLTAVLPAGVRLRLDANCAWSLTSAAAFLDGLQGLPLESVEEPLASPSLASLKTLQQAAPCTLALDESIGTLDLTRLLGQPPVRRLVLKPILHGGLLPCLKIAGQARRAGMEVLVTTSLDSAAGTWAAAQLAAALGTAGANLAHGLGTSDWLGEDLGLPPQIEQGVLRLPDWPGLGFRPS